jgi:primosomal replication protein N
VNRARLSGRIVDLGELRHTPAGLPILRFVLGHASEQSEAGHKWQVECEVPALAMTETAEALAKMQAGDALEVEGFLARKSRNSMQLVLHVQRFKKV